jgi:hypothetical protein
MHIQLPLDDMTTGEKLELIQIICADLATRAEDISIRQRDVELLRERRRLIDEGQAEYVDWDVALAEIRSKVRESTPTQTSTS